LKRQENTVNSIWRILGEFSQPGGLAMGRKISTQPVFSEVRDGRVTIPNNFCEAAKLFPDSETIDVSLWMVGRGRYRLLAGDHRKHPDVEALRGKISEREGSTSPTEFDSDAYTVIDVRLLDTHVGKGKERRLALPPIMLDILKIRKHREAVVVLDGSFVEIWSVETFESANTIPTSELL
jgi:DNA-binding transcriptional regulator/RsmH inhibitor MraZ